LYKLRRWRRVIYYVIPRELADKYYDEFRKRFAGVEGVEVIIDRREANRRALSEGGGKRVIRDRRRRRMSGSFPDV
jgi:ribosomal protein L34